MNELEIELRLEKLKSSIYRDIIENNTSIILPKKDHITNIFTEFNEIRNLLSLLKDEVKADEDEKKKDIYRTFKNCTDLLVDEPTIDEQNNKIVEIDKNLQNMKKSFVDLSEAKDIFEDCFKSIKKDKTYSKTMSLLRKTRMDIIGLLNFDEYMSLLKEHYRKLENIFKEKEISEKLSLKNIYQGFSTIDARLLSFPPYILTPIEIDDITKFKTCLQFSNKFPKNHIPFINDDLFKLFLNHSTIIATIGECLERNLFNIYGFFNIVYIQVQKSTDADPFSFFVLKKIDKPKRYWHMDCRLEDLSNKFIDNVRPFLIDMFRRFYFGIYSDYDYRKDFYTRVPKVELDFAQMIQNICLLSNPKKFNKYLRNIVKQKATINATHNDIKNFSTDDTSQRRRFENEKEDIDPVEIMKLLFDNISSEEAVDFYRSKNIFL